MKTIDHACKRYLHNSYVLEAKRKRAIKLMGKRWILHPANRVVRAK